jgi:hypothetical protein
MRRSSLTRVRPTTFWSVECSPHIGNGWHRSHEGMTSRLLPVRRRLPKPGSDRLQAVSASAQLRLRRFRMAMVAFLAAGGPGSNYPWRHRGR